MDEPRLETPVRVAAAVVRRDGRLLLTQRPPDARHALLWEFPGGKIEPGETPGGAVVREIAEELGVGATAGAVLDTHRHAYPDGPLVEIVFIECELESEAFRPSPAVHALRWVRAGDVDLDQVLAGDHGFLVALGAGRKERDGTS